MIPWFGDRQVQYVPLPVLRDKKDPGIVRGTGLNQHPRGHSGLVCDWAEQLANVWFDETQERAVSGDPHLQREAQGGQKEQI